jgi:hypothetical protein
MAEAIADCEVLLCGGMGEGAHASMQTHDIKPLVTDIRSIDEAVQAYLASYLDDQVERLLSRLCSQSATREGRA